MKMKARLKLALLVVVLTAVIYTGFRFAVSYITGQPFSFGFWSDGDSKPVQNFVVAGVDEDGLRTDLILLCQYNLADNSVDVLQIPRDTKVETERYDKKINSAYGSQRKTEALYDEIESVTGIRPDKHVIVNFKGFRELVDEIGGVDMNVPMRMYYTDPAQNLVIDLYPGQQHLDGRKAEMFMRFRKNNDGSGYPNGDLDRLSAQKTFYSAVMDKLISFESLWNASDILSVVTKNVNTNFSGDDIFRYVSRIPKFRSENVRFHTLPGAGGYDTNGISYFFCDKEQTKDLIDEYFDASKSKAE